MIGTLQLDAAHVFLMRQAVLIEREIAGMTDDALHLDWVFEKSSTRGPLSSEVIANDDIEF